MEELKLRDYWYIIRKRWAMVVAIPIIAAVVSALFSAFFISPKYESTAILSLNTSDSNIMQTCSTIVTSPATENTVIRNLKLNYTTSQLNKMITVTNQAQVLQIQVTSTNEVLSTNIANSLASSAKKIISTLPNEAPSGDIANLIASETSKVASSIMKGQSIQASIISPAINEPNAEPIKPHKKFIVAIATVLGTTVSVGLAFLLECLDDGIRTEADVKRYLNMEVLGVINEFKSTLSK